MRAFGPGQRGLHTCEVQRQRVRKHRVRRACAAEQRLLFGVALQQAGSSRAAGAAQITQRLIIRWKEAACSAVLRRHVGNCGAVGQRHSAKSRPKKFHKLVYNTFGAQHLRDRQHQIGGSDAFAQLALQFEPNHLRRHNVQRLAEHDGLGFNAAHAPAQHTQPVNHGGVRVGAH